jgi:hypothetical protein
VNFEMPIDYTSEAVSSNWKNEIAMDNYAFNDGQTNSGRRNNKKEYKDQSSSNPRDHYFSKGYDRDSV